MIISIGEIVWDIFNEKKILGGAPLNAAYHLSSLDMNVRLVSRIGRDKLSNLTLQSISAIGLSTEDVQIDDELPTGQVVVSLDRNNQPSFDIVAPAAWDAIDGAAIDNIAPGAFHLLFGTLAQRSEKSRRAIQSLWDMADIIFYDVNLRPPFTPVETVLASLQVADVVKLNDDELHKAASWSDINSGSLQEKAERFFRRWNLHSLAVTLGEKGALLICPDGAFSHPGFPAKVVDTVGSGDAFFAGLIEGIINKRPWQICLERANRRGAYVAGKAGATPPMKINLNQENFSQSSQRHGKI